MRYILWTIGAMFTVGMLPPTMFEDRGVARLLVDVLFIYALWPYYLGDIVRGLL